MSKTSQRKRNKPGFQPVLPSTASNQKPPTAEEMALSVSLSEIDGRWHDIQRLNLKWIPMTRIARIEKATNGGQSVIAMYGQTGINSGVILRTTAKLFLGAARAIEVAEAREGEMVDTTVTANWEKKEITIALSDKKDNEQLVLPVNVESEDMLKAMAAQLRSLIEVIRSSGMTALLRHAQQAQEASAARVVVFEDEATPNPAG